MLHKSDTSKWVRATLNRTIHSSQSMLNITIIISKLKIHSDFFSRDRLNVVYFFVFAVVGQKKFICIYKSLDNAFCHNGRRAHWQHSNLESNMPECVRAGGVCQCVLTTAKICRDSRHKLQQINNQYRRIGKKPHKIPIVRLFEMSKLTEIACWQESTASHTRTENMRARETKKKQKYKNKKETISDIVR